MTPLIFQVFIASILLVRQCSLDVLDQRKKASHSGSLNSRHIVKQYVDSFCSHQAYPTSALPVPAIKSRCPLSQKYPHLAFFSRLVSYIITCFGAVCKIFYSDKTFQSPSLKAKFQVRLRRLQSLLAKLMLQLQRYHH